MLIIYKSCQTVSKVIVPFYTPHSPTHPIIYEFQLFNIFPSACYYQSFSHLPRTTWNLRTVSSPGEMYMNKPTCKVQLSFGGNRNHGNIFFPEKSHDDSVKGPCVRKALKYYLFSDIWQLQGQLHPLFSFRVFP